MAIQFNLNGSHIIGGDASYDCIDVDTINNQITLNVEFQLFRDGRPNPDPMAARMFDSLALFGVYRNTSSGWVFVTQVEARNEFDELVPPNDLECLVSGPTLMSRRGLYRFDLTLDMIDDNYMIAYQRCCRGVAITNIVGAQSEGSVFNTEITPEGLAACTQGIKYRQFPPQVLCSGFPFRYDHSVVVSEGDSVVYELCTPLSSGRFIPGQNQPACGDCTNAPVQCGCDVVAPCPSRCVPDQFREVVFSTPLFTNDAPIGGSPQIGIDRNTGLISGTPRELGELVMAVCATVYRDGVELTTIRRDMQFVVTNCERRIDAAVASDKTSNDGETFELLVCGDLEVNFISESTEERFINEYAWSFDLGSSVVNSSEQNPTVNFPGLGQYDAKLVINPGSFVCSDSADIEISLFPNLIADFDFEFDSCIVEPIDFVDLSQAPDSDIQEWAWDFNDGDGSLQQEPTHLFTSPGLQEVSLQVTDDNGCVDTTTQNFFYTPLPENLAVLPNFYITCVPGIVTFDNVSGLIDSTYDILWDFGDGTSGPESRALSPTHVYEEPGIYTIVLSVTSPSNCTSTQSFNNFVEILDGFSIDFTFTPDKPTIQNNVVTFTGTSDVAGEFFWTFGDGGASIEQMPIHTYQDTGTYDVTLQVTDETGCIDSLTKTIIVAPIVDIVYPNAFTPNGDDKNDLFIGANAGSLNLVSNYKLLIFDRWGKVVFSSSDPRDGWNGRLNNSGQVLPIGVYSYLARYDVPIFGEQEKRGVATLVR